MYHSIYIGEKNTWDDFHLVPSTRPVVASPEVRTMYIDVHGTDGTLDLSTALTGGIQYKNREGSWSFVVANWYENWEVIHHKLSNYLHGKQFKIVLEDDPHYYYLGRLSINEWKSDKINSSVTINYYLDPYKYELNTSIEPWLWDPFNFETGIIREYGDITVDGTTTLEVLGSSRPCILKFVVDSSDHRGMTVQYGEDTYALNDGEEIVTNLVVREEDVPLTITGHGTISVVYQGGWL